MSQRTPTDPTIPGWQSQTAVVPGGKNPPKGQSPGGCLVIIYSSEQSNLGKRFVLDAFSSPVSVGRGTDNTIVLEHDSVSRRHARFELREGAWWVVDLRSTNGTYVNDEQVSDHKLGRGEHIKIGDTILKYLSGSDIEAAYHEEIYRMTIVDGLTEAHNRRYLYEQLDKELARSRRYRRPLTMLLFDLDRFKSVNDTYGHLAGDYVLKEVAGIVRSCMRRDEVFARYGGEEFAILLPETSLSEAEELAEVLRDRVAQHLFVFEQTPIPVTVSIGVAELLDSHRTPEEFVDLADRRLYEAKNGGRNRVVSRSP